MRVLLAFMAKAVRLHFRYPADAAALAVRPLLGLLPFWLLSLYVFDSGTERFSLYTQLPTATPFLTVGFLLWAMLGNIGEDASSLVYREMTEGTLESMLLSPTPAWKIFLGHAMGSVSIALIGTFAALIAALLLFRPELHVRPDAVLVLPLAVVLVYNVGLVLGGITLWTRKMYYTYSVLTLLGFLAGPAYPVTVYPTWLQWIARLSPLTYAVDAIRSSVLGTKGLYAPPTMLAILAAMCLGSLVGGPGFLALVIARMRRSGGTGQY
jgi:ABC-2 type transport system permease protein